MEPYKLLLSPLTVNKLELRNRMIMPATHLNYTPGGKVNDRLVAFYRERAKGGTALAVAGGAGINDLAGGPILMSIKQDDDIPGLKRLADAVHEYGMFIGVQLYMAGAYAHSMLIGQQAISSSTHTSRFTREEARGMTLEEIAQVQDDFAAAAARAQEAGLDMVEILGSAGYLISQFLSPAINKREDEYGGSLENRMRFGLEVVKKVRERVGPDFCVGVRVAGNDFVPGGNTNPEAAAFAAACAAAGVDLINVTGGWHETRVPQLTTEVPLAGLAYLARGVKEAVNIPVAASNRVNHPAVGEEVLARGDADLICIARPLFADPEFPNKAARGQAHLIRRCIACNQGCFDRIPQMQPAGCLMNPRTGREHEPGPQPVASPKRVLVVGGGAAGCEAALTAARRGHKVVLLEAGPQLGGQPVWYARPTDRPDFLNVPAYYEAALAAENLDMRLNTEVTPDLARALEPDVVIVATGARPAAPPIPGADGGQVLDSWEVLKGEALPRGRDIVVIGGGAVGLETALNLARRGALTPEQVYFLTLFKAETPEVIGELITKGSHRVTVLEMLPKVGKDIGKSTKWIVLGNLKRFGIKVRTKVTVNSIEPGAVNITQDGRDEKVPADCVVMATGVKPVNQLAEDLKSLGCEIKVIGDAAGAGSLLAAIEQGYQIGCEV